MSKQPKYSIVVPAYQEELFIGTTLDTLQAYLKAGKLLDKTEVIVVVADSLDKTASIANSKRFMFPLFELVEPGKRAGKGRDVRAGVLAARGQYILFTDADLATPAAHIAKAWKILEEGHDLAVGERNLRKINQEFHRGIGKHVSKTGSWLARLLIAPNIKDTQCGFKAFNQKAANLIFQNLKTNGWAFDMEIIAIARQKHLKITTLNIDDWHEPKPYELQLAGDSRLASALKSFGTLIRIKLNLIRGKYKLQD